MLIFMYLGAPLLERVCVDSVTQLSLDYSICGIFQARILEQVAISYFRDLPDSGIEPMSLESPALAGRLFTTGATWKAVCMYIYV